MKKRKLTGSEERKQSNYPGCWGQGKVKGGKRKLAGSRKEGERAYVPLLVSNPARETGRRGYRRQKGRVFIGLN